jgi:hypothetical protein
MHKYNIFFIYARFLMLNWSSKIYTQTVDKEKYLKAEEFTL